MKGAIELNWKILVAVIAAIILFLVVFLVMFGMLKACNITMAGRETCLLLISKLQIFGVGAETLGICDVFQKCPE